MASHDRKHYAARDVEYADTTGKCAEPKQEWCSSEVVRPGQEGQEGTINPWLVTVQVNDVAVQFCVDTGAEVTVIPAHTLRKHWWINK